MSKTLKDRALLVTVNLRRWGGTKVDRKASEDIAERLGASQESVRVIKDLVKAKEFKDVQSFDSHIRNALYRLTLPWLHDGRFIVSSEAWPTVEKKLRELERERETLVQPCLDVYEEKVRESQTRLGKLFNPNDYPSLENLRRKFTFRIITTPVPDREDWRTEASDRAVRVAIEQAAKDLAGFQSEAEAELVPHALERVSDVIREVSDRFKQYHAAGEVVDGKKLKKATGVFRDSFTEKLDRLAEELPLWNPTGNQFVDELCDDIVNVGNASAEEFRKDEALRLNTATKLDAVQDKIEKFLG